MLKSIFTYNKSFNIICIIFFLISGTVFPANEHFRSLNSGNWNSISSWQMSTNGGGTWFAATSTPTDTSGPIAVRSPNTITVTVNVNANQLTVENGGTLSINNGITLSILAAGGTELIINGGGTISGLGTIKTIGNLSVLVRNTSNFNAAFRVTSGTVTSYNDQASNTSNYYGTMTLDTGATLTTPGGGYYTRAYANVINNGTIVGNGFIMRGSSLTNNNNISPSNLDFDSTTSLSGSGSYSASSITVNASGNVSLANNITFSPSSFLVANGGIFNPNTRTFTINSGTFYLNTGGTTSNSGIFQTQGNVSVVIRNGSNFRTPFRVASGIATSYNDQSPHFSIYFNTLTVNASSVLTTPGGGYTNLVYGNVTNNGTIGGNKFTMNGSSLTNSAGANIAPSELEFDSVTTIFGAGTFTGSVIVISSTGNVTLGNNVSFSPSSNFQVAGGGVFNPNTRTFTLKTGAFYLNNNGTVFNSGLFQTQGNVSVILRNGSIFNAPFKVDSGTTQSYNDQSPHVSNYYSQVTVDPGSVMTTPGGGYTNQVNGNVTNNGTIAGNAFTMSGDVFINNGTVSPSYFYFDTTISLGGTGIWNSTYTYITGSGYLNIANTLSFGATNTVNLTILASGVLNPNSYDVVFNGTTSTVNFEIQNNAATINSGRIQTKGNVTLNIRNGSNFNTPFNIATGTSTISNTDPPHESVFNRIVTIDTGSVFTTPGGGYTCTVNDTVINNGTLTGPNTFKFMGLTFINNGIVSFSAFHFASTIFAPTSFHNLSGTGSFTTSNCQINEGANLKLLSDHQFSYLSVNAASTLDITSRNLKLNGSGTSIAVSGNIITNGSTIEYNGTSAQNFPQDNISYENVKFNNPAGVNLVDNVSLPALIQITSGDLNLNGKILTLLENATLSETPGNTITGNSGFIVMTRNLNAPNNLNVGGLGAQITTLSNLGLTEIKRGANVQTLPLGNQAIRRWYSIKPFNNSNLNATLVFNYDTTELNGNDESKLTLFRSTNAGVNYVSYGGTVNIALNQVTQNNISSFARFTVGSTVGISLIMEGFYNLPANKLNMSDTVRAYLRNTVPPYSIADSAKAILDSLTFRAPFQFSHAGSGTYYIHLKHRNSLETWSKNGVAYTQDSIINYDFTFAASQAYGNNMVLKGTNYCLYSGDVTQDGSIDLNDVIQINNNATNFATGYVVTDANGNSIVDLTDVLIAYNNSINFVSRKTPLNP